MINFNIPPISGNEAKYIAQVFANRKTCGDGEFTKKVSKWLEEQSQCEKVLLTTSCTSALEMSALLIDICPDDEVIMPSFTFVSTADAFVLRGAKIVFVDIRPDTMNIDENLIEEAITEKTRAIVPVHYAGVGCDMDTIMAIAERHNLSVIEDAAQGFMAYYKNKALGTFGKVGCLSFHETKNVSMGEGGALLINRQEYTKKAEIMREKGTNRSQFLRGEVDKYSWVGLGASFLPSEINVACLFSQLEIADKIQKSRMSAWARYYEAFKPMQDKGRIKLPYVPSECTHNAHMFYLKFDDLNDRDNFITYMKKNSIQTPFHYVPLHSAPAGLKYGRFCGVDKYTTSESNKLARLPLYYGITNDDINMVTNTAINYMKGL